MATLINFDFDSYINSYKGHTRFKRALFIARHCPSLQVEAYHFAINEIKNATSNIKLYEASVKKINTALTRQSKSTVEVDKVWVKTTSKKNKLTLEQLERELNNQVKSMVKESIRAAQMKLGEYHYNVGNMYEATKCYERARKYCTTSKSIMDICFNMIKIYSEENRHLNAHSYIIRAISTCQIQNTVNTLSRLSCYQAISALFINGSNQYQAVAQLLTQNVALESSHTIADIMSPSDVAIYGGLCAMASFDRPQLQDLIKTNMAFRGFLDLVPHIREIMEHFQASEYASCFALIENYLGDWKLDLYLNKHIDTIFQCIKEKGMVQYCIPYSIIDMHKMAFAFNITTGKLESELVRLIGHKRYISARIDSNEKILYSKRQDQRKRAVDQSFALGAEYEKTAKALMVRMNLFKAGMVVK
ncbi:26S proteasome subunit RPN7-domain-containing protein [Absidia repens]|uniref:26S proteasome subunit RPN7-domain-containing protein n=1 Tax=Absidia repens TaxID=90262 RepID=A0A1X2IIQ9_9FUNG|nr:26S proteasome subunit RPN7-domain-containing protein [Absidia repens]